MTSKRILPAALLLMSVIAGNAQTSSSQIKEEGKTEFVPHWFMQVQAGAAHTRGEAKFGDLISPAGAIYGGYQFTPLWGLRAGISGWQAKGGWAAGNQHYKYNYLQGNVDATLDLSNLFCRYNPDRFFNAYMFVGVGLNGAFNNDEAVALANKGYDLRYLWTDNKISPVGRAGLGTNLRLTSNLFFNIEVNANVLSDKFNSKKAGNADWQFNALAGFTIKFGKTSRKTEPVYYEPTPQPAPVVKEEPKPVQQPAPVKQEKINLTENVFFTINSSKIQTTEEQKIEKLAEFMKNHADCKVTICGYADKQTGNANINMNLSKKRAEAVAAQLKEKGIDSQRITVDYKGDTVQPFSTAEENRVTICIAE
ncbi:OmpA family protein [Phocaeicola sp.]|uniref:OmpA family protein n=1 Tax=Phocaeicola sp. TaxID=2773926 RepID=UPI003AB7EDFC